MPSYAIADGPFGWASGLNADRAGVVVGDVLGLRDLDPVGRGAVVVVRAAGVLGHGAVGVGVLLGAAAVALQVGDGDVLPAVRVGAGRGRRAAAVGVELGLVVDPAAVGL